MVRMLIVRGKAVVKAGGLRCQAFWAKSPDLVCNKLLVKTNASGQIAGNFLCGRCKSEVEVGIA
jgi:hypothetical protein